MSPEICSPEGSEGELVLLFDMLMLWTWIIYFLKWVNIKIVIGLNLIYTFVGLAK